MKKRTSKRRWIARCRLGRSVPALAIYRHGLDKRFVFEVSNVNWDTYTAVAEWVSG